MSDTIRHRSKQVINVQVTLFKIQIFAFKTQRNQVGNRQYASMLLIIPIVMAIHGHRFEIFTLVLEIHENVDLVLGIKIIFELEGIINLWQSHFSFLNRLIPFFPKEQITLKPKEQQLIKIETPFVHELAIVKILDKNIQNMMMLKLKFVLNLATLDVTNNSLDMVIFDPKKMLSILDLRLVGYFKIEQGMLQQNLSRYYRFESADVSCEQFNKFVNT